MFGKRKQDDFSEELRSHLELEADQLRADGYDDSEARRRASLTLGNRMLQQERFYEAHRWAWLDQLRQDIRYSLRQFRQAPGFALTAVLTLAIGIGATAAIFTLIHAVLLKSLPVTRPGELYLVGKTHDFGVHSGMPGEWDIFSTEMFDYLREHTAGLDSLAAFQADLRRIGVRRKGDTRPADSSYGEYVSGNYFATLGVTTVIGRAITEAEDRSNATPVAIMSYRVWNDRYAQDPSVLGSTFLINGAAVTVIGVAPPQFFGETLRSTPPDFWMPLHAETVVNRGGWYENPQLHWLRLIGRVQTNADVRAIEAQMLVEVRQWLTDRANTFSPGMAAQIPQQTLHLEPGGAGVGTLRTTYADGLELLMAISGFVLLIVCANLANLMLVRGIARRRQTSISLALGAARGRLIRQALTEAIVLALIGGAAGIGIAFAATQSLLAAVFSGATWVPISPRPELPVLAFAFGVSILTGVIFGIAPAWNAQRADPIDALRGAGRTATNAGSLTQRTLVVGQAAISLVLVATAGLLTESLRNLAHQSFGFSTGGRVAARIDPNLAGYKTEQLEPLYQRIRETMGRLPGAAAVTYSLYSPMSGSSWTSDISLEGQPPPTYDGQNNTWWNRVGPNYFEIVGTPLLRGRTILESANGTGGKVAVVNEAFVRRFLPNQDPIGHHFSPDPAMSSALEIVGVVADAKYSAPGQPVTPMYFLPRAQLINYSNPGTLAFEKRSVYANDIIVKFTSFPPGLEQKLRDAFAGIDPNLTVLRVRNFDDQVELQFSQESLIAKLTGIFGLTALLLASIGLYGVSSYSVAQRSREIGIRMAMGAARHQVVAMVLRSGYLLVAIGLLLGFPLALGMGHALGAKLYQVKCYSPGVLLGAAAALALCALAATIVPARRAATLDPIDTLRET